MTARIFNPLTTPVLFLPILSDALRRLERSSLSHTLNSGCVVHAVRLVTLHLCCSSTRIVMAVYIPEAIALSVCKETFQISEEVIGHWLIKLYVLFWWSARDVFVRVFNTQAQPWKDQWQLCWLQVRRFSVYRSFPEPFFLHLEILQTYIFKKKTHTHTRTQCILPLYCWLTFHSGGMRRMKHTIHL